MSIWWHAPVVLIASEFVYPIPADPPWARMTPKAFLYGAAFRGLVIAALFSVPSVMRPVLRGIGNLWEWIQGFFGTDPEPVPYTPSNTYGSARYAPVKTSLSDENCLGKGVFLGKSSYPESWAGGAGSGYGGIPICTTAENHTLIVARTRTGKGTRVIIPTLLRYRGSALVIDPKGENAAITARTRLREMGQGVHLLNPWNELEQVFSARGLKAASYNPLDILDRNDPNVVAIANALAATVCPANPDSKDQYWEEQAATVVAAVLLWLTDRPEEQKTLARVREIVSLSRKELTTKFLVPMAASGAFSGAIREMAAPFVDLPDNTYGGIMSNVSRHTKFLSDPRIKEATKTSSFSMRDLTTGNATVYVVIPTEQMDTQKAWLRLVIASAMHVFKHRKDDRRNGHRCLFLIDEFAALGRFEVVLSDIATMSGFGVDFALVVQGLDQLKAHYHEAHGTILSNCAYKWFCNIGDLDTAEYVSRSLGNATVRTVSSSHSSSSGTNNSSNSESTTYGETGRPLASPDELLSLGKEQAIAMQPNGRPLYLEPVNYWDLPNKFAALRKEYPSLYWTPPLVYDENPYASRRGNW